MVYKVWLLWDFINTNMIDLQSIEDAQIEGISVWAIIFYCLRCGDLDSARNVAESYEYIFPDFCSWINVSMYGILNNIDFSVFWQTFFQPILTKALKLVSKLGRCGEFSQFKF